MGLVVVGLGSTLLMRRLRPSPAVAAAQAFAARFSIWGGFGIFALLAGAFFIQMQPNPSHGNSLLLMGALVGLPLLGIGIFGVLMPILFWGRLLWNRAKGRDSSEESGAL